MADINATPLHAPGPDMGPDEHAAEVDLARREAHDVAHAERGQLPMQAVAERPGLVATEDRGSKTPDER